MPSRDTLSACPIFASVTDVRRRLANKQRRTELFRSLLSDSFKRLRLAIFNYKFALSGQTEGRRRGLTVVVASRTGKDLTATLLPANNLTTLRKHDPFKVVDCN